MAAAIQQRQRDELHRRIWQIANDVRGAVDGWDFKQYVLGALFYRFISLSAKILLTILKVAMIALIILLLMIMTLLLRQSKKTPSKQKAILFTQANCLKMSWQQPTLIRI